MNQTIRNGLILLLVAVLFQFFGDEARGAGGILALIGIGCLIVGLLRPSVARR
jgi:hypothetical protein